MSRETELWKSVVEDATLQQRASAIDPSDVAAIARLRRAYTADQVAVAIELMKAREKAVVKFGERGRSMVADVQGIEQASSYVTTAYCKAARFIQVAEGDVMADLCCGLGGDSLVFDETAMMHVVSVDRDPLRVWMTRQNTGGHTTTVCSDVSDINIDRVPIHIDPARRDQASGRRVWRLKDYRPGPDVIGDLIRRSGNAAIKLSPGVDTDELPWPGELEFISDRGRLVQAVLWTGGLAQAHSRSASLIDKHGNYHSLAGEPTDPPLAAIDRYLYTIDPAVERAQIIAYLTIECGAYAIHPKLGLLTSNTITTSPWIDGFELIEQLPWRPKRVKQWLAANDGGLIEVKTRGKACDPDIEQRRLRGDGSTTYTIFVLRFDTKVQALITRRLTHAD